MSSSSKDTEQDKSKLRQDGSPLQEDKADPYPTAENDFMLMMYSLLEALGLDHLFKENPETEKELLEGVKPENLVTDQVFISAVSDMVLQAKLAADGLDANEARDIVAMAPATEAALRASINKAFEKTTESGEAADIGYKMGAKGGGVIDCSGFVQQSLEYASATVGGNSTRNIFNFNAATYSGAQIDNALKAGGSLLTNKQVTLDNLKPGMIIGMDTGDKGWDAGRKRGIDHVVLVYKDSETGELMIGQSSSSGGGVNGVSAESWLNKWQKGVDAGRVDLYAVDTVPLVKEQFQPKMDADNILAAADNKTEHNSDRDPERKGHSQTLTI